MQDPQLLSALAVLGIFMVRFGVPLLLSAAVVWWLHRLDVKWAKSAPKFTAIPDGVSTPSDTLHAPIIGEPCWVYRACPDERRNTCPAYLNPQTVCWLARLRCDGRLAGNCRTCSIFATSHAVTHAAAD